MGKASGAEGRPEAVGAGGRWDALPPQWECAVGGEGWVGFVAGGWGGVR